MALRHWPLALVIFPIWAGCNHSPSEPSTSPESISTTDQLARLSDGEGRDRGFGLAGLDLSGRDLRGADIPYSQLQGTNLSGADLSGASISKADLTGADLSSAILHRTNVTRAILRQAILERADLRGANLVGADLTGARLKGADLGDAYLTFADLRGVEGLDPQQLSQARWASGRSPLMDPRWSEFLTVRPLASEAFAGPRGPDLAGADLSRQNLENANLRGSDLSKADFTEANLRQTNLEGANLHQTVLTAADLTGASNLTARQISEARWDPARPPRLDDLLGEQLLSQSQRVVGAQSIEEIFQSSLIIDGLGSPRRKTDPSCPRDCRTEAVPLADMKSLTGVDIASRTVSGTAADFRRLAQRYESSGGIVIRTVGDLARVEKEERFGIILYIQQVPLIEGDPSKVKSWFEAGVRIVQPAYSSNLPAPDQRALNKLAGGADEPDQGLTELGRQVIRELVRYNVIIDVSHCSEKTTFDILQMTDVPILANHANAKALTLSVRGPMILGRNKTDRELKAIAATGGVIGVNIVGWMLDTNGDTRADIDDFLAHLDYMVKLVGIDHVGVASDAVIDGWGLDEIHYAGDVLARPERWKIVAQRLREDYGYTDLQLKKILGLNFKRVYQAGLPPR